MENLKEDSFSDIDYKRRCQKCNASFVMAAPITAYCANCGEKNSYFSEAAFENEFDDPIEKYREEMCSSNHVGDRETSLMIAEVLANLTLDGGDELIYETNEEYRGEIERYMKDASSRFDAHREPVNYCPYCGEKF